MEKGDALDAIHNRDCIAGMADIRRGSVDLIVTDPPFAINFQAAKANYNRTPSNVMPGYNEVRPEDYGGFTRKWMAGAYRTLKRSGSMYVFSGWNGLKDILGGLDDSGFVTVNHIIWKYQFGVVTRKRYVTSHYHCLYVCKDEAGRRFYPYARFGRDERTEGGRSMHYRDKEDVWEIKREYWKGTKKTPTKLPSELVKKILGYSSKEGDVVMDPFLGSGQVAVVAKSMGRRYIGFEVVPEYYEFARERLESGEYLPKSG